MSALDDMRANQHNEYLYDSDHQWSAFLHTVSPDKAYLDRISHASDIELHMLFRR